ncbi:sigma-54-dependent transcriptional regulator [Ferrimonas marina]|uniref:Two-component system, NtrC family, response regulator n=2 Tax=Ferrimonas marina TaxID=299255 RepID=A0A1M5RQN9_9GAMM|nr:sigma-54 dependent transcriptional regulator [Ferrimonas marina]SHH28605.1 two-component system, NtrC family, response regulator [Ferrimonas marina]
MSQCRIVLLEDDPAQRELLSQILTEAGHKVHAVATQTEAEQALAAQTPDLLFSDWKLAQGDAGALIEQARRRWPTLAIVVATAYGSIEHAVHAIKLGADDYLAKPFTGQAMLLTVDKLARARALRQDNLQLKQQLSQQERLVDLIGHSAPMQALYQRIERVSQASATVLIQGESGTGKELAARALHKLSQRSGPFIAVNCGAIPASLAESELFGAEKGAYTGAHQTRIGKLEAAHGGTLFLDEIGELPLELQTRLLRALQEGSITRLGSSKERPVDLRVIAATHRDLAEAIQQGQFREDLYYRLNVIPLTMPPLRQRPEDIPALVHHFVDQASRRYGCPPPTLAPERMKTLMSHPWPGNVRQLGNVVERLVLLDELVLESAPSEEGIALPEQGVDWDSVERGYLEAALQRAGGNRSEAARLLNLGYKAFLYRLDKHGL